MAKSSSVATPIPGSERPGPLVADELDTRPGLPAARGRKVVGHRPVDEQGLGRVADPGPLRLGVDHDRQRHVEIGGAVHVDVAVPVPVDHAGDGGLLPDGGDERCPASGDQAVDHALEPHELDRRLAAGVLDEHHDIGGQSRLLRRLAQAGDDGHVGPDG